MTIGFGQRIADLLGDLMSTAQPVEVKIFGNDYETLQKIAAQVEKVMEAVPGIVDIDNGLIPAGASIVFTPNQERLSQFGISLTDFQEQLTAHTGGVPLCQPANMIEPNPAQAAMTGGLQIGSVQDGEQMRRILLRFTDFGDNSPERLEQQPVFLPDGSTRPLGFFCDVRVIPGEIEQRREDLKSNITLTGPAGEPGFGQCDSRLASVSRCAASSSGRLQYFLRRSLFRTAAVLPRTDDDSLARCLAGVRRIDVPFPRMADLAYRVVHFRTGYLRMSAGFVADGRSAQRKQLHGHHHGGGHHCRKRHLHRMAIPDEPPHGWRCVRSCRLRHRPAHPSQTDDGYRRRTCPDAIALGIGLGAQMQQPLAVAVIGGFIVGLPLLLLVLPSIMLLIYKKSK